MAKTSSGRSSLARIGISTGRLLVMYDSGSVTSFDKRRGPRMRVDSVTGEDVLVIDSGGAGIGLCAELRERGHHFPIIVLIPDDRAGERVRALAAGADDCLTSPVDRRELLARAAAISRRRPQQAAPIRAEGFELKLEVGRLDGFDQSVMLTPLEGRLLSLLMRSPGRVVSRDTLLREVWHDRSPKASDALNSCVRQLRRKLPAEARTRLITVRGIGYQFGSSARAHPTDDA